MKSHQLKKGLLSNQSKLQTNNYTTVFVENLRNANSFQNQSWLFWRYFSRTCIRIQVGSRNWYCCTQANEKDPSIWNKKVSWYLAFIILHFNYCSPETWHFCNKNIIANELALRFFFFVCEKRTSYCELPDKIGLPSLTNQRLAKIACAVLKVINSDHASRSIKV